MHYKQFMQFVLSACHKFRFQAESVLIRPEMGQIASNSRLLDTKKGPSSISIQQVGTRTLKSFARIMHSKSEKFLVPATLPLVTAYVALPLSGAMHFTLLL